MTISNRDWEKLKAHAEGKLGPAAALMMDGRLADEPKLAAAFERIKREDAERQRLLQESRDRDRDTATAQDDENASPFRAGRWRYWGMAACLAAMGLAGYGLYAITETPGWQQLAEDTHQSFTGQDYAGTPTVLSPLALPESLKPLTPPDMEVMGLMLADRKVQGSRTGDQIAFHYRGLTGCSLTLVAADLTGAKLEQAPLPDRLTQQDWSIGNYRFATFGNGITGEAFASLNDHLRQEFTRILAGEPAPDTLFFPVSLDGENCRAGDGA